MISLSLKFGIPVRQLEKQLTVSDVMEYMAYDLSESEEFRAKVKREKEMEESRKLSAEQFAERFKKLLGGGNGNDKRSGN